jgi:hypothetical protein
MHGPEEVFVHVPHITEAVHRHAQSQTAERARPPPSAYPGDREGRAGRRCATTQLINRNFSRSFLRHF